MSKHLTLSERIQIAAGLELKKPLNQIAAELGKNCSTVSREIRKHSITIDTLDKLLRLVCQTKIDPEKIVLKPSLLR